jgi:hypothetical protein
MKRKFSGGRFACFAIFCPERTPSGNRFLAVYKGGRMLGAAAAMFVKKRFFRRIRYDKSSHSIQFSNSVYAITFSGCSDAV